MASLDQLIKEHTEIIEKRDQLYLLRSRIYNFHNILGFVLDGSTFIKTFKSYGYTMSPATRDIIIADIDKVLDTIEDELKRHNLKFRDADVE